MAGGAKTTKQRDAALEAAARLLDMGSPGSIVAMTLQRQHGYSRAQAFRIVKAANEQRGSEGISARPTASEMVGMTQQALAGALAEASEAGDWQSIVKLSRELREALKANGSITTVAGPEPDSVVDTVMAVKAAHTPER